MTRRFINRKEIAQLLEVSIDTVRREEIRWGIAQFRRNVTKRQVDYVRRYTMDALQRRGLLPDLEQLP
jgi:hypothetical protein